MHHMYNSVPTDYMLSDCGKEWGNAMGGGVDSE